MQSLCRSFATLRVKPPLQFKPMSNKWKPSEQDSQILRAISNEFRSRLVARSDSDKLTQFLAYRLDPKDLKATLGAEALPEELQDILSLRMASQSELNAFNKHQAMQFFGRGPNDTGSPEVQAGLLTVRIGYLLQHKQTHIHDYSAIRLIVELVHERKRHLKYLRRLSISRYFELLDKLGLPHNYLESFDNPYLYRYRNNGEKALHK